MWRTSVIANRSNPWLSAQPDESTTVSQKAILKGCRIIFDVQNPLPPPPPNPPPEDPPDDRPPPNPEPPELRGAAVMTVPTAADICEMFPIKRLGLKSARFDP